MSLLRPSFMVSLYGRERFAGISGALAAFVMTANALAPLSAGAFCDVVGSYDPLFWGIASLSLVSAGVILLVRADATVSEPEARAVTRPAAR